MNKPEPHQFYSPRFEHHGHWYVPIEVRDNFHYLHQDGVVRGSTENVDTGKRTGFFPTEEAAQEALNLWEQKQ